MSEPANSRIRPKSGRSTRSRTTVSGRLFDEHCGRIAVPLIERCEMFIGSGYGFQVRARLRTR